MRKPAPLPKTLKVGATVYAVEDGLKSEDAYGDTSFEAARIRYRATDTPNVIRETLLHEALHAANFFSGLWTELGRKREEALTNRMAPVLLMILRDNPSMVTYLLDEEGR